MKPVTKDPARESRLYLPIKQLPDARRGFLQLSQITALELDIEK